MESYYDCNHQKSPVKLDSIKMQTAKCISAPLQKKKFNLAKPLPKLKIGRKLNFTPKAAEKLKKIILKKSKNKIPRRRNVDRNCTLKMPLTKFNRSRRFISPQPRRNALKYIEKISKARILSPNQRKIFTFPQNSKFMKKRKARATHIEQKLHAQNYEELDTSKMCFNVRKNTVFQKFNHSPLYKSKGNDRYNRSVNIGGYEVYDSETEQGNPDLLFDSIC
ncbi:unnamed protein product [Moneuplotes crassus]|uniref:Uncharacterized protein n=1 Tax=Euplotes crassus TaxID=5936 RepID=A0AAD1YBF3_EUPCR|nr:unnamed protein product [Moneuplotes crassus]